MSKKNEEKFVDDGRTVYDMNIDGFKWYKPKKDKIYLNKKEKWAMICAAFAAYFPKLLIVLLGFGIAVVLLYFWLIF